MPDMMLTWRCTIERYVCPHFVPNFRKNWRLWIVLDKWGWVGVPAEVVFLCQERLNGYEGEFRASLGDALTVPVIEQPNLASHPDTHLTRKRV
jgi:hypothetical protein